MPVLENFNEEELNFIRLNLSLDPLKLSLKFQASKEKRALIEQISARQKLRKKLPDWVKNEQIRFPQGLPLEQASSQLTAQLKASEISGKKLIDLTGGLGVDCFYLSQSFHQAIYIEQQETLAEYARYNFGVLGTNITVRQSMAEEELIQTDADVVYLDPHRRSNVNSKQFLLAEHQPNVLNFIPELVKSNRKALIKTSPMLDIRMAVEQLQKVEQIWVISLSNDCKEVLYLLSAVAKDSPLIRTWNRQGNHWQYFEGLQGEHHRPEFSEPQQFLFEPNASIFKAGLHDLTARDYKLKKLGGNSHVYTGNELLPNYPGRVFKVENTLRAWDKQVQGGRYNVISRNFHESAAVIEKKLKLKSAKEDFIIASKLADGRSVFIVAKLLPSAE